MKLRPHHLLDIISSHGQEQEFAPHPYGHALHTVAACVIGDPTVEIEFVLAADAICTPCCHLQADGTCDDILSQLAEPVSKQRYNDELDGKLFPYLGLRPGTLLTVRTFLVRVHERMPGIAGVCAHPGEDPESRLHSLRAGLRRLGIEVKPLPQK